MTEMFSSKQILDYGKSHGYSPKEISKVLNQAKSNLVDYGINAGYKGSEINQVLNNQGYSNYNPLTAKANWQNLLPNLSRNAKEFARDMRTMGGVVIQPFTDVTNAPEGQKLDAAKQSFMNAINNDALRRTALSAVGGAAVGSKFGSIGAAGGAITGGLLGLLGPKNLTNAILQPYETSTQEIGQVIEGNKKLGDVAADILQGGIRNPLYSGLDVLSAGGAKGISKAVNAIGDTIPSNAPMFLQELFPSSGLRTLNRTATNAFQYAKSKNAELIEPLEKLESTLGVNKEAIVRNILTNEGELAGKELEIANELKAALRKGERKASEYSLLKPKESRINTVAQYGMQKLMDVVPDLLHDDLVKYIRKGKLSKRLEEATLKNPDLRTYLDNVIDEGKTLYDEDKIAFLTQALAPTLDPRGEVIANVATRTGNGYFGTNRIIGRATSGDLAKVLEDSAAYQQRQITKATEAVDVIEEVLSQPGVGKLIKDVNKVPEGYTVINPEHLRKNLARELSTGRDADVVKALKESGIAEQGAYMIPNVYFKALDNMFSPRLSGGKKDVLNAFKKTVLASPHWFLLNRIGNMTNNSMGGVKIIDYGDALAHGNLMPRQLKAQTSFNAYVGDNIGGLSNSITKPLNTLTREVKKFAESDKSLGDMGRVAGQIMSNTSNIFSNPIFRLEAASESVDRFANFIRQAKREAKLTGEDWKSIVKKANTDSKLYNKLNNQVNMDLGDYVGRNYLLPNSYYDWLGGLVPFYRFLTQTGRTSFHQLANHPLAFQSTVIAPAKAGKQFSEDIINQMGLDPETYEGGVPYSRQPDGTYRYIGAEPLPAGAVIGDLLSASNKLNLISPMYSMLGDVMNYKKGEGWLPSSPGLTQYKMATGTTKGYEPTLAERLGYGASQFGSTFYAPLRMGTGWMRELGNAVTGKPTLSLYDSNILRTNPLSYAKELPIETIGKWAGIQSRPYYPKYIERPKRLSKNKLNKIRIYNEQYNRNTKGQR